MIKNNEIRTEAHVLATLKHMINMYANIAFTVSKDKISTNILSVNKESANNYSVDIHQTHHKLGVVGQQNAKMLFELVSSKYRYYQY